MGGPKWVKPAHGHNKDRRVAKKTRADTDTRKKLSKDLAPPKFTKFEPERFKRRRLGLETAVNTGKPSSAAVANLKLLASRAEEDFKSKQELTAKPSDGFIIERKQGKTKDGTYRAYYKEFRKVVEQSDVLLEVLDARDPVGCRCLEIEKAVMSEFHDKKKFLLILNKVDLVPREVAELWLAELREQLPVVAFTSLKGAITNKCIDCLHKLLNGYARTPDGGKKRIIVGVIGYPNVGKSSVINALKRTTVVAVGNTPGFTKHSSEVPVRSSGFSVGDDCAPTENQRQYETLVLQGLPSLPEVKNTLVTDPSVKYETGEVVEKRKRGKKRGMFDDGMTEASSAVNDYDAEYMRQYMRPFDEDVDEEDGEDEEADDDEDDEDDSDDEAGGSEGGMEEG